MGMGWGWDEFHGVGMGLQPMGMGWSGVKRCWGREGDGKIWGRDGVGKGHMSTTASVYCISVRPGRKLTTCKMALMRI